MKLYAYLFFLIVFLGSAIYLFREKESSPQKTDFTTDAIYKKEKEAAQKQITGQIEQMNEAYIQKTNNRLEKAANPDGASSP